MLFAVKAGLNPARITKSIFIGSQKYKIILNKQKTMDVRQNVITSYPDCGF